MRPAVHPIRAVARRSVRRPITSFICAQCRAPILSTPYLSTRHASSDNEPPKEKLSVSEKLRRRMWGTDNPPGQKDPYSRASPEEMEQLMAEEERLQAEEAAAKSQKRAGRGWMRQKTENGMESEESAMDDATVPENSVYRSPSTAPTQEDLDTLGYVPAQTWDGLTWRGGKHTRAVEVEEYMATHPFEPYVPTERRETQFLPDDVREALVEALIHQSQTNSQEIAPQAKAAIEGSDASAWEGYDISKDLDFKFDLIKRVMHKTGYRIADPAIDKFATAGDIVQHLVGKAQPTKLADKLAAMPEIQALPHVKIHDHRLGQHDRDVETGNAKTIRRELERRGLWDGEEAKAEVVP